MHLKTSSTHFPLSAEACWLMLKIGIRKDLSLLFASESLPIEFNEEPIFSYDNSEGPYWNYAQRYHNIYKKIRNDGGRNYLKLLISGMMRRLIYPTHRLNIQIYPYQF